jgi:cytoskeletal protein CcmA (bactofilin family)
MWRKEEGNPQPSSDVSSQFGSSNSSKAGPSSLSTTSTSGKAPACISQGIKIKGEVTGTEDLFIDGRIEGKITLSNSAQTVGPNGVVKADITAKELVFRGVAEGKFTAEERIQIWHSARVQGDLKSDRISIEEGAELRGKVEAGKAAPKAAAAAAGETVGRSKKNDSTKVAETTAKDVNVSSDAATAGAD